MRNTVTSMTSELTLLSSLLGGGNLTCDLSDADDEVAVFPLTFAWRSSAKPFFGLAHTVHAPQGDLDAVYEGIRTAPSGRVLIVETGGSDRAMWGETTTLEALRQGVVGVVLDGACRDVPAVRASGLPVVARGVSPKRAARTGLGSVGEALQLYRVTICPGDLVVSDENGTVIVPQGRVSTLIDKVLETYKEAKNGLDR